MEMKCVALCVLTACIMSTAESVPHCTGKYYGCQGITCANLFCPEGSIQVPGDEVCSCCPVCAIYLNEGDSCNPHLDDQSPFRICRSPLTCNGTCVQEP